MAENKQEKKVSVTGFHISWAVDQCINEILKAF